MADTRTPEQRRKIMQAVKPAGTGPEIVVRRALFALGYRYRLHSKRLPGRPDIVFHGRRKAIFVHGCFWHGHACPLFRLPATRQEFWRAKIEGNAARDKAAEAALLADGWRVLTIWECALKGRGRLPAETVLDRAAEWLVNGPAHEAIAGGAYGGI